MNKGRWCFVFGLIVSITWLTATIFTAEPQPIVEVPKASEKALEYYRSNNVMWIIDQLVLIAFLAIILFSGISAKLRNLAKRWGRIWLFEVILYVLFLGIVFFIVMLPVSYYADYVQMHHFGLSTQSLSKWIIDTVKSSAVTIGIGAMCTLVIYFLIKKSPKRWWLYSSLLTLPFIILSLLIAPLWLEPLFNTFGPMKNKALEANILALADRAGITGTRVFEVEKSVDTNTVNAYVTGFSGTKRIVLWDTIIKDLDTKQLLFVMGHEMGHYVLDHVEKQIIFQFAMSFFLFLFLSTGRFVIKKYGKQFKMHALGDIASLPLLLLMSQLFMLATAPIDNAFSRHFEHEADRFGLEITQNNYAAATAFVKLQEQNLANPSPGPMFMLWRGSHPCLAERIEFANTYRPWSEGHPLKYQKYIKIE